MQDISNLIIIIKQNIKSIFIFFILNFILISFIFYFLFTKKINDISLEIDLQNFFDSLSTTNLIFEIEKENFNTSEKNDIFIYSEKEFISFLDNTAEIFNNKSQEILNNNQIYNLTNLSSDKIDVNTTLIGFRKDNNYSIKIIGNFDKKINSESLKLNIQKMIEETKEEVLKFLMENYKMQLKYIDKINTRHKQDSIGKIESLENTLNKYYDLDNIDENSKELVTNYLFLNFIRKETIQLEEKSKFNEIQVLDYVRNFIDNQNNKITFNLLTSSHTYERSNLVGFYIFLNIANLFIVIFLILFYDGIRKIK